MDHDELATQVAAAAMKWLVGWWLVGWLVGGVYTQAFDVRLDGLGLGVSTG